MIRMRNMKISVKRIAKNLLLRKFQTAQPSSNSVQSATKYKTLKWMRQNDPKMHEFFQRLPAEQMPRALTDYIGDYMLQNKSEFHDNFVSEAPAKIRTMLAEMQRNKTKKMFVQQMRSHFAQTGRNDAEQFKTLAIHSFAQQRNENAEMLAKSGKLSASQIAFQRWKTQRDVDKLRQLPAEKFQQSINHEMLRVDPNQSAPAKVQNQRFNVFDFVRFVLAPIFIVAFSLVLWKIKQTVRCCYVWLFDTRGSSSLNRNLIDRLNRLLPEPYSQCYSSHSLAFACMAISYLCFADSYRR